MGNETGGPPTALPTDYVECGVLGLCFLIGVPVNIFSLLSLSSQVGREKALAHGSSTTTLVFLRLKQALNASDLFVLLLCVPTRIAWLVTYEWLGGDFLCRFIHLLLVFAFAVSSNLIAVVALDRWKVVQSMGEMNCVSDMRTLRVVLAGAYCISFLVSVPQFFVFQTIEPYPNWHQCVTIFTVKKFQGNTSVLLVRLESAYGLFHLLSVFWAPCIVVIGAYAVVYSKVHSYARHRTKVFHERSGRSESTLDLVVEAGGYPPPVEQSPMNAQRHTFYDSFKILLLPISSVRVLSLRRARKGDSDNGLGVFKSTLLVVALHLICWAPYNVVELLRLVVDPVWLQKGLVWTEWLQCLIFINAVLNPFIYSTA